jgi:hypothetical protein
MKKVSNGGKSVRFETKGKSPQKVGAVVKYGEMVLITRCTGYQRGPQITMNEIKVRQSARLRDRKRKVNMTTELTCVTNVGGCRPFIT